MENALSHWRQTDLRMMRFSSLAGYGIARFRDKDVVAVVGMV